MTPTIARPVLAAAVLLGLTGDLLLRGGTWRLGLLLFVLLGLGSVLVLTRSVTLGLERRLVFGGVALAASGLVLRDAEQLYALDMISLLCVGALAVWQAGGRKLGGFAVKDSVRACILTAIALLTGAPHALLASGAGAASGASTTAGAAAGAARWAWVRPIGLGALVAILPLFLVAVLLGQADPVFEGFLSFGFDFLSTQALGHVFVIVLLSWLAAGWLWSIVTARMGPSLPDVASPGMEFSSIAVALYGLVGLLTVFLGLQGRVLFGGAAYLAATTGLSVAEYARNGFFDLIAVTAVVLGTLLATHWLLDRTRTGAERHFRTGGWALILLVTVLMLSALVRMGLYVRYFGLSADRYFATAVMLWIAMALGWFAWTVLRGQSDRFGVGILAVSTLWVAALNASNPEALVVRVNLARAADGRAFDVEYHARLSADALPALIAGAALLPSADCIRLGSLLAHDWATRKNARRDWRGWSLPHSLAARRDYAAPSFGEELGCGAPP